MSIKRNLSNFRAVFLHKQYHLQEITALNQHEISEIRARQLRLTWLAAGNVTVRTYIAKGGTELNRTHLFTNNDILLGIEC